MLIPARFQKSYEEESCGGVHTRAHARAQTHTRTEEVCPFKLATLSFSEIDSDQIVNQQTTARAHACVSDIQMLWTNSAAANRAVGGWSSSGCEEAVDDARTLVLAHPDRDLHSPQSRDRDVLGGEGRKGREAEG